MGINLLLSLTHSMGLVVIRVNSALLVQLTSPCCFFFFFINYFATKIDKSSLSFHSQVPNTNPVSLPTFFFCFTPPPLSCSPPYPLIDPSHLWLSLIWLLHLQLLWANQNGLSTCGDSRERSGVLWSNWLNGGKLSWMSWGLQVVIR